MNDQQNSSHTGPERTAPTDRFAGESRVLDLDSMLAELRSEAHPARNGHRQMTVFRRAPVTKVLFAFDADGRLADHSAHGLVNIHVLEGLLRIQAGGSEHTLGPGQILILNPDVPHDLHAAEPSAMLLTVHLESND